MSELRLAVVISHPIQYFAPWHQELARRARITLRVLYCCDWGVKEYFDPGFKTSLTWDIPLLDGYDFEFMPIKRRPTVLDFWQIDNPSVSEYLSRFDPDVIQLFGYAHRTSWRVRSWAGSNEVPLLLFSDSVLRPLPWAKKVAKDRVVRHFYRGVSGALSIGDQNRDYHRYYGLPDERIFPGCLPVDRRRLLSRIENPQETRAKVRDALGIPRDAFVCIVVGKLISRKRPIDTAIAVSNAVKNGSRAWCLMVGEGPLRAEIEILVKEQGWTHITLAGLVNQSEIPRYYAAADVLVMSSSFEPYGVVATEAACFGLPMIVSDAVGCIGPNDVARPGENVISYPVGDIGVLTDSLMELERNHTTRQKMSEASKRISLSHDVSAAAQYLENAAGSLRSLGVRMRRRSKEHR